MKDYSALISAVLKDDDLHAKELPAIDLYLDQIISLFDNRYASVKRRHSDKLLTNAMIHNYRKAGLIKPIKGKRYTREHVIQMLAIFAMKNTLTIQDIKAVFDALYRSSSFSSDSLVACYEKALELKGAERELLPVFLSQWFGKEVFAPQCEQQISEVHEAFLRKEQEMNASETFQKEEKQKENTPEEMFPLLLSISFLAGHLQRTAEHMVDAYFMPSATPSTEEPTVGSTPAAVQSETP